MSAICSAGGRGGAPWGRAVAGLKSWRSRVFLGAAWACGSEAVESSGLAPPRRPVGQCGTSPGPPRHELTSQPLSSGLVRGGQRAWLSMGPAARTLTLIPGAEERGSPVGAGLRGRRPSGLRRPFLVFGEQSVSVSPANSFPPAGPSLRRAWAGGELDAGGRGRVSPGPVGRRGAEGSSVF